MDTDNDNNHDGMLREGDLIAEGKYEIQDMVGAGGMGRVYRAKHMLLGRTVAIKVLHPDLAADPKIEARFLREARATSRLDHRNSMQVLDFGAERKGDSERLLYIVMEFLEGVELSHILYTEGPLSTERIAFLGAQVCAALFQAHEQGIVHRDLKPENIMIISAEDDDGLPVERVKVCDFGIAKIQSSGEYDSAPGTKLTEAGEIFGTPPYMSPEQARGKKMDDRSDIYSLGVVLFEMATGKLPFVGENMMGILAQHISDPPPRPSSVYGAVGPDLEATILRCLEKDPADRFQSVRDLRANLQHLMADRSSPTPSMADMDLARAKTVRADSGGTNLEAARTAPLVLSQTEDKPSKKDERRSALPLILLILLGLVGAGAAGFFILSGNEEAETPAVERATSKDNGEEAKTLLAGRNETNEAAQPPAEGADQVADSVVSPVAEPDTAETEIPEAPQEQNPSAKTKKKKKRSKTGSGASKSGDTKSVDPATSAASTEPEPSTEPKPTAPTAPEPQPEAAPKPEPVAAKPPSLDARVTASLISVQGSLPQGPVKQGLKRVIDDYRSCYRKAASAAGRDWSGKVNVSFVINVDGRARNSGASGGGLPGLDKCLKGATSRVRSSTRPDTGTVQVKAAVRFSPVD